MEYTQLKRGSPELRAWKSRLLEGITLYEAAWLLWDLEPPSRDRFGDFPPDDLLPVHISETSCRLSSWYVERMQLFEQRVTGRIMSFSKLPPPTGGWERGVPPWERLHSFAFHEIGEWKIAETDLREFEKEDPEDYPASVLKGLAPYVSRSSLLRIIAGMAADAYRYKPEAKKQAEDVITRILNAVSAIEPAEKKQLDDETLRKALREAFSKNPRKPRQS